MKRICPACGTGNPEGESRCGDCGFEFFGLSVGNRTIPPASSVQESIRQSIIDRTQQEAGSLMVRPAETINSGVRLFFATDTSGSMIDEIPCAAHSRPKIDAASVALQEALRGFPSEVVSQIDVGVGTFAENAKVHLPMDGLDVIRREFRPLTVSDCGLGTNIAGGLKLAGQQLNLSRRTADRGRVYRVILLLSDGNQTVSGDPLSVGRKLKSDRMLRIITIGFGTDMNRRCLEGIASPGLFFEAFDTDVLRRLYAAFQRAVSSSIAEGGDIDDHLRSSVA